MALNFRIRKQSKVINSLQENTVNDTTQDHDGGLSANLENQTLGSESQLYEEIDQQVPSSTPKSNQFELTECPAYGAA